MGVVPDDSSRTVFSLFVGLVCNRRLIPQLIVVSTIIYTLLVWGCSLKTCNCNKPEDCPVDRKCLKESVICQATVANSESNQEQTYVGLTANTFKKRFYNHECTFNNEAKKSNTELSKHIWELNNSKIKHRITWKILKQAKPYDPATNRCNLCLCEKYFIINKPQLSTLNKRNDLFPRARTQVILSLEIS